MAVTLKTAEELEKMRVAGRLAAEVLEMIEPYVVAGVSTGELDSICYNYMDNEQHTIPAPLNYRGFPKSICTSVNQVVCHGIPSTKKVLKNGDILNIDITVIKDGYFGDTSKMFCIGDVPEPAVRLIKVTQECLYKAIILFAPASGWVISAISFSNMPRPTTTALSETTADTESAQNFTRTPKYFTLANRILA